MSSVWSLVTETIDLCKAFCNGTGQDKVLGIKHFFFLSLLPVLSMSLQVPDKMELTPMVKNHVLFTQF